MKRMIILMLIVCGLKLQAQTVSFAQKSSAASKTQHYDTHVVAQGETLFGISRKYHTTVDELKKLNPGVESSLTAGKTIRVPVVKGIIAGDDQPKKPQGNSVTH